MPVKRYGIYLAFPPAVDLRAQGLGRHLAMFLKGAHGLPKIHFTIVCPSWTLEGINDLFLEEDVPLDGITILAPVGKPLLLRVFQWLRANRVKPSLHSSGRCLIESVERSAGRIWAHLVRRVSGLRRVWAVPLFMLEFSLLVLVTLVLLLIVFPFAVFWLATRGGVFLISRAGRFGGRMLGVDGRVWAIVSDTLSSPHRQGWVLQLFEAMQFHELQRMHHLIAGIADIRAWYCPTAFWPSFHDIRVPRLMCVPDVVLRDFPAGFALVGGDFFLQTFQAVERAIRKGDHFVAYSQHIKWHTLVGEYGVPAGKVMVVPHAPNSLTEFLLVEGENSGTDFVIRHCRELLRTALARSENSGYMATFLNDEVKFLFYASQFRPNKNIITLLRAYEHLLRQRNVGHKLFLTGHPDALPEVARFVQEQRLEADVIFLHGLSLSELAACYKLADLAVNPTLSEGGCPFTFTEALSVGTPVVMSDIAVSREILSDSALHSAFFFDPYDWLDCASKIEWALKNRDQLLHLQIEIYQKLSERTWSDVAAEHIAILDRISSEFKYREQI